jgi:hypothetical protein
VADLLQLRLSGDGLSRRRQLRLRQRASLSLSTAQRPDARDAAVFGRAGLWPARSGPNASAAGRHSVVCLGVKPAGEPDAGNPHVRFDERRRETASWLGLRYRRSAKAAGPATPCACHDRARLRLYKSIADSGLSIGRFEPRIWVADIRSLESATWRWWTRFGPVRTH